VNLTERQHEVLTRMARGGVLFVRLEPSEEGTQQTCWIGTVDLPSMTVNALITARLIEPDTVVKNARQVTTSYFMNIAGRAALERSAGRREGADHRRARTEPLGPEEGAQQAPPRRQEIRPGPYA
jgi:hypothetical protein